MTISNPRGDHAVVLGASMAGLLAARVLTETYPRVTVVDRDAMPAIGQHRRGVPQGRHLHVLHPRGAQVLDELFPGLLAQMTAHGAVRGDTTGTGRWQLSGHRFRQENSGISGVLASRPFLEGHVRAALGELPGATLAPVTTSGGSSQPTTGDGSPGSAWPPTAPPHPPGRCPPTW